MSDQWREAISALSAIVAMIDTDVDEGRLNAPDATVILAYSSGGTSEFLTLGMARAIVTEFPCLD